MAREYIVSLFTLAAISVVLAIGFAFPAIVARDGWVGGGSSDAQTSDQEVAMQTEQKEFCQANLSDVNCACFARKAGHILAQPQPNYVGYTYADRTDLAVGRGQHQC